MWCRSVRGDKSGSRGQGGSPGDQDGIGIPSRSAPASSHDSLIDALENALRLLNTDAGIVGHEFSVNIALGHVEREIRRWWAKKPKSRFSLLGLEKRGRPPVLARDVKDLRDLRAANPGSDCYEEFKKRTGVGQQQARIRYKAADKKIAKTRRRIL
jgi:hypothetical protein